MNIFQKKGVQLVSLLIIIITSYFLIQNINFSMTFVSIVLEGLPFILLGSILASIIHVFLPNDFLEKHLPKNRLYGVLIASVAGIIFPVCECSIVPIIKKLTSKGMPINIAITFLLSAPIINPIVLLSTYYAFGNNITYVILRGGIGLTIAILIGYFLHGIKKDVFLKEEKIQFSYQNSNKKSKSDSKSINSTNLLSPMIGNIKRKSTKISQIGSIIYHSVNEFFSVGKFFIAGAFCASIFQSFLPRTMIASVGGSLVLSIVFMMLFAYLLSVCSESDAFIAKSFQGSFTPGSIISFITYGPMIDLKNTLMLLYVFKKRFVIMLIILITIENFIFSLLINLLVKYGELIL